LIRLSFFQFALDPLGPFGRSFGRICSPFELPDRTFGKRWIAVQVVRIEDRAHIAQAVAGDGGDLGFGAAGER